VEGLRHTTWRLCQIFLVIEMFIVKLTTKKLLMKYSKEDQEKLFVLKPLYQRALIVLGGPLANFY